MYSGFWRRFCAYVIDATAMTVVVMVAYGAFFGFDDLTSAGLASRDGLADRFELYQIRHLVRDLSFVLLLVYGAMFEASPLRATPGKYLLGMEVVDGQGQRLSFLHAVGRNAAKLLSYLALSLGFLAVAFSRTKQGWHDRMAGTFIVRRGAGPQGRGFDVEMERAASRALQAFRDHLAQGRVSEFSVDAELAAHLRPERVLALKRDRRLGALMRFIKMYTDALVHGFPDVTLGVSVDGAAELVELMAGRSTDTQVYVAPKVYAWSRYLDPR